MDEKEAEVRPVMGTIFRVMPFGYCQHSGKCHKKVKLLLRPSFSILYARNKIEKENEGLGTRD